jgi:O-antigen/teichoic acid export membrane protein
MMLTDHCKLPMAATFSRIAAIKAAAIMTLSTYATIALGLVVSAVLARSLGPDDYGRYAYVLWIVGLLIALGNHGIPVTATRLISEALGTGLPGLPGALQSRLKRSQWASVAVVAVAFLLLLPLFEPSGWHEHLWLFGGLCVLCFACKSVYQFSSSVAKGHGAFWVEAWGNMIISGVYTAGVVALTWQQASLTANLVWYAGVCGAHLIVIAPLLRKAAIRAEAAPLPEGWDDKLNHYLKWTSLQVLMLTLGNRTIETYLLNRMIGTAEVGYFAIASNLTRGGIELLSSSLSTLLMPSLAHAKGAGGMDQVKRIMSDATRYFLFMGAFLAGVGVLWASPGIHLMYGANYAAVVPALQVMVLLSGLLLIDNPLSSLLLIIDDQRIRTVRAVAIFVLGAIAALVLVPAFGLLGAAMASGVSGLLVFLVCSVYVSRLISFTPPWRELRRIALSAALGGVSALAVWQLSEHVLIQWLAGAVYGLVLLLASGKLGVWKRHDVVLMINIAQRKPALFGRFLPALNRWAAAAQA